MTLKNFRIGQQLTFAFGFVLIMMVLLNITGGYFIEKNKRALRDSIELLDLQRTAVANLKAALLSELMARHTLPNFPVAEELPDNQSRGRLEKARAHLAKQAFPHEESEQVRALLAASKSPDPGTGAELMHDLELVEEGIGTRSRRDLDAASAADGKVSRLLFTISGIALLLIVIVAWKIVSGIVQPLQSAVSLADRVAEGNLTSRIIGSGNNEVSGLISALRKMNDNLVDIVSEVRSGTDTLFATAKEIAQGNSDLSRRTEAQATTVEEAASAMAMLVDSVKSTAANASNATRLARSACTVAAAGGQAMMQVEREMEAIRESARKIVEINAVIDGIAFQTNVLALNASVEAAKAGEQGRAFAVVAAEVRVLAQRSAAAATEINALIADTVEKVERGTGLVEKAGKTIAESVGSVEGVAGLITDIATASREQSEGIQAIGRSVATFDEITQQNSALVEEAAAATEGLRQQADDLLRSVSVFALPSPDTGSDIVALA